MANDIEIRPAGLDDTAAISRLFQARIHVWQRLNAQRRVEDVPYESLTLYQRWLHGGPWMSVETGAIQLAQLLLGAGLAMVATVNGEALAYAEAYPGVEPPFGPHLHLAHLVVHPNSPQQALETALLTGLIERATAMKAKPLTISRIATNETTSPFSDAYSLTPLARLRRVSIAARTGQIFFKAVEHANADPAQINGWQMPLGRLTSARQEWETLWPHTWDIIPELKEQRPHRLRLMVAGQEAFLGCKQHLYDPRSADISCWSPKPLTPQLLTAIRDWAHREGYRTLVMVAGEDALKVIGPEAEADGYVQDVCAVTPANE